MIGRLTTGGIIRLGDLAKIKTIDDVYNEVREVVLWKPGLDVRGEKKQLIRIVTSEFR
jgi:hypothetical protein